MSMQNFVNSFISYVYSRIVYAWRTSLYSVTIDDEEELRLPSPAAIYLGETDILV
jgi:hypothetical protein